MISIIDASITSSTSDAGGENIGGKMRCLSRLYPATLYRSPDINSYSSSMESQGLSVRIGTQDFLMGLELDERPPNVGPGENICFMPVHYGEHDTDAEVKEFYVVGLILQPDRSVRCRFERVARFTQTGMRKPTIFDSACEFENHNQLRFEESRGDGW